jgi:hypothetical protein
VSVEHFLLNFAVGAPAHRAYSDQTGQRAFRITRRPLRWKHCGRVVRGHRSLNTNSSRDSYKTDRQTADRQTDRQTDMQAADCGVSYQP